METLRARLATLPDDQAVRGFVLREALSVMQTDDVVDLLDRALESAASGDGPSQILLTAFSNMMIDLDRLEAPLYDRLAAAYSTAIEAGNERVCRLFRQTPPARTQPAGDSDLAGASIQDVSTGMRTTLSRTRERRTIEKLIRDPSQRVVEALLENPRLTESDALAIAARRPATTDILRTVFNSRRWKTNRRVRLAIALNPYSPPVLAMAVLHSLSLTELMEVALSEEVHASVSTAASEMARARKAG